MLFLSLHVTRCSPLREIPKNAFSTSCPEVEELYLNYICQSLIPLSKRLKLSPYGKRT